MPFCALQLCLTAAPSGSQAHITDWDVPEELVSLAGAFGLHLAVLGYLCPVGPGTGGGEGGLWSSLAALPCQSWWWWGCSVPACQALVSF